MNNNLFRVTNLSFSYDHKKVLSDINFSLSKGNFVSIIGPNGSGKTTLLNLLMRFLFPLKGEIFFKDKLLTAYKPREMAQEIAYVPQDSNIRFPFTCLEVVLTGRTPYQHRMRKPSDEDLQIVLRCMEETDTLKLAESLITEISGGERQRIVLAKALAQTPEVYFLDEAFSAMDIHYRIDCLSLLKKLVIEKQATVVAVMHDINMADNYSDQVLALHEGKLLNWGAREKVMQPDFLKTLFKVEVERYHQRGLLIKTPVYKGSLKT